MISNLGTQKMEEESQRNFDAETGEEQMERNQREMRDAKPQEFASASKGEEKAEKEMRDEQQENHARDMRLEEMYSTASLDLEAGLLDEEKISSLTEMSNKSAEEIGKLSQIDYEFELKKDKMARDFAGKVAQKDRNEKMENAMAEVNEATTQEKLEALAKDDKQWDKFVKAY